MKKLIVDIGRENNSNLKTTALLLNELTVTTKITGEWIGLSLKKIANLLVEQVEEYEVDYLVLDKNGIGKGLLDYVEIELEKSGLHLAEGGKIFEKLVATKKELKAEFDRGYEKGLNESNKKDDEWDDKLHKVMRSGQSSIIKKTSQEVRDEIIERAKKDIENLKRPGRAHGSWWDYREFLNGSSEFGIGSGKAFQAYFEIDKEKRTVTCTLKGYMQGHFIQTGVARCAPDDCFNEDIGKAIALRRALNLEMLREYLNVPNPTEVRVGNVVESYLTVGTHLATFEVLDFWDGDTTKPIRDSNGFFPFEPDKGDRIIDDSTSEKNRLLDKNLI